MRTMAAVAGRVYRQHSTNYCAVGCRGLSSLARDVERNYKILKCRRDASDKELRRAFLRQAGLHHPDRNPNDVQAHQRFIRIRHAFEVCFNDSARAKKRMNRINEDTAASLRWYKSQLSALMSSAESVTRSSNVKDLWKLWDKLVADRKVKRLDVMTIRDLVLAALLLDTAECAYPGPSNAPASCTELPAHLIMLTKISGSGKVADGDALEGYHFLLERFSKATSSSDAKRFIETLDMMDSCSVAPNDRTHTLLQEAYSFSDRQINSRICAWISSQNRRAGGNSLHSSTASCVLQ